MKLTALGRRSSLRTSDRPLSRLTLPGAGRAETAQRLSVTKRLTTFELFYSEPEAVKSLS